MGQIFNAVFYQPILNLLVFLYNIIPGHDIGIAIIILTVIIKLMLLPLSKKMIKSQKELQDIQPKVDELKAKYKDNKEEMTKRMMALYSEHKINPFSSCLPLFIQLPFLWAVFRVFQAGLTNGSLDGVYSFIHRPEMMNTVTFGFLDLSVPNVTLAIIAGVSQFWQAKMMMTKKAAVKSEGAKDENMAAAMNKQMLYMMPALTIMIGIKFPGGLTLYWIVSTLLTAFQQKFIFGKKDKKEDNSNNKNTENKVIEGEVVK